DTFAPQGVFPDGAHGADHAHAQHSAASLLDDLCHLVQAVLEPGQLTGEVGPVVEVPLLVADLVVGNVGDGLGEGCSGLAQVVAIDLGVDRGRWRGGVGH